MKRPVSLSHPPIKFWLPLIFRFVTKKLLARGMWAPFAYLFKVRMKPMGPYLRILQGGEPTPP